MRLTFDIFQAPQAPGVWISRCVELNIFSQHTRQDVVLLAITEEVLMTLQHAMKQRGLSYTEAFEVLAREAGERRRIASPGHDGLDINRVERACHEWKDQLGNLGVNDDERIHLNGDDMLALITVARAAMAVRDAHRSKLCGACDQSVQEALSRALDEAGLGAEGEMQRRPQ